MLELTEAAPSDDLLGHRHRFAIDHRVIETETRLAIASRGVLETFDRGRGIAPRRRRPHRIKGMLQQFKALIGENADRCDSRVLHFIKVVKHGAPKAGVDDLEQGAAWSPEYDRQGP